MSVELAQAHPNLKLVVEDYKKNVEKGAAELSSELTGRVDFVPHNFFDPQPVAGADVYILRHICHDWSAENSVKILSQIVPAMKPGSKILLVEIVVSPPSARNMTSIAERYLR
jgi:6-hydroxytryprostatin B O-methyltransferase